MEKTSKKLIDTKNINYNDNLNNIEEGEITSNNDYKTNKKSSKFSRSRSSSKYRSRSRSRSRNKKKTHKSKKYHKPRSRSKSSCTLDKHRKNHRKTSKQRSKQSRKYCSSKSSMSSSSTEKINKSKKDKQEKKKSQSPDDTSKIQRDKKDKIEREKEKDRDYRDHTVEKHKDYKIRDKDSDKDKKSHKDHDKKSNKNIAAESPREIIGINKLGTFNFSTKRKAMVDSSATITKNPNIKIISKSKNSENLKNDNKLYKKKIDSETKTEYKQIKIIMPIDEYENLDLDKLLNTEKIENEREMEREQRRKRLEEIKKINEPKNNLNSLNHNLASDSELNKNHQQNLDENYNDDKSLLVNKENIILENFTEKENDLILLDNKSNLGSKVEKNIIPSENLLSNNETLGQIQDSQQEIPEFKLNLKLAEELDFIKDNIDIDLNFNINSLSTEERQRLLHIVEKERNKNLGYENYDEIYAEKTNKISASIPEPDFIGIGNKNKQLQANANNKMELDLEDDEEKVPDMFTETPVDDIDPEKKKNLNIFKYNEDNTGYYSPKLGEIINSQYKVTGYCGKGIFSTVVKVVDINNNHEFAIKIVRNIDIMVISAEKEKSIIKKLNEIDKHDKTYIIRMINTFEFKRHICMVFELGEMNLRDLLKSKLSQNLGGIGLSYVKLYARQLLIAFALVHKLKIIHSDFKPDNTIICKNRQVIKLCDFGSALREEEIVITSELVSRFYRAPEILLGCTYDTKIDIWSLGCTLFEIYTGNILFPGRDNNEMLKLIMQIKGKIPQKILKRGQFTNHYFNDKGLFLSHEIDNISKKDYTKELEIPQNPTKDLLHLLKFSFANNIDDDRNLLSFKDFLEKCLHLDPNKRFSAVEALCHPFIEFNPIFK